MPNADDARQRLIELLEAEIQLSRQAISAQGVALASLEATLHRFDTTVTTLTELLKDNLVQVAEVSEVVGDHKSRLDLIEERLTTLESIHVSELQNARSHDDSAQTG